MQAKTRAGSVCERAHKDFLLFVWDALCSIAAATNFLRLRESHSKLCTLSQNVLVRNNIYLVHVHDAFRFCKR